MNYNFLYSLYKIVMIQNDELFCEVEILRENKCSVPPHKMFKTNATVIYNLNNKNILSIFKNLPNANESSTIRFDDKFNLFKLVNV